MRKNKKFLVGIITMALLSNPAIFAFAQETGDIDPLTNNITIYKKNSSGSVYNRGVSVTPAKVIYDASVTDSVSPKVILAILQKNRASVISSVEAEKVLRHYFIDFSQWEDDYVLAPLNPAAGEIGSDKVYRFEVRYKDTVEEVGGRLVSNYAVSADGKMIFRYDPANDEWIIQNEYMHIGKRWAEDCSVVFR